MYPDRIMVWNAGELPENWGVERLFEKHPSLAPNPSVANGFFRAGDIEAWGRGYRRMARVMSEWKLLPPVVRVDNGLMVTLYCDKTKQMRTMGKNKTPKTETTLKRTRACGYLSNNTNSCCEL